MLEKKMLNALEELLVWTKASSFPNVKRLIQEVFSSSRPEERLAYELLDGTKKQGEIVKVCKIALGPESKISSPTLSIWVSKWEKMGLVIKKEGRNIRCFSLIDFGIDVPLEKVKGEQIRGAADDE